MTDGTQTPNSTPWREMPTVDLLRELCKRGDSRYRRAPGSTFFDVIDYEIHEELLHRAEQPKDLEQVCKCGRIRGDFEHDNCTQTDCGYEHHKFEPRATEQALCSTCGKERDINPCFCSNPFHLPKHSALIAEAKEHLTKVDYEGNSYSIISRLIRALQA